MNLSGMNTVGVATVGQLERWRIWMVRLTYFSIAVHLVVGALLPLIVHSPLLEGYHHSIETVFWGKDVPPASRALQTWWISLFGPTVQAAAVWMGALAWIGDRQRLPFAWGALIAGIVLWAPQDMLISLRANCWSHVGIDAFAIATMLPPLFALYVIDRKKAG
jgi:hypothetical protein